MTDFLKPNTKFHWRIYADATMAGLAILIPVPGVDWFFEDYFRRQIPLTLANRHQKTLDRRLVAC